MLPCVLVLLPYLSPCPITPAASFQHNSSHRHCPVKAEADAPWSRPQERVPASSEGRGHRGADDRQQPRNIWRGNATLGAEQCPHCRSVCLSSNRMFILKKENCQKLYSTMKTLVGIVQRHKLIMFCTIIEYGECFPYLCWTAFFLECLFETFHFNSWHFITQKPNAIRACCAAPYFPNMNSKHR